MARIRDRIKQDPSLLLKFTTPPVALQEIAVKSDPMAIRYITNPRPSIQFMAVQQDYQAIRFINDPCKQAKIAALVQNPIMIAMFGYDDFDLVKTALTRKPELISMIPNPTFEMQRIVYEHGCTALYDCKEVHPHFVGLMLDGHMSRLSRFQCRIPFEYEQKHLENNSIGGFAHIRNPSPQAQELYLDMCFDSIKQYPKLFSNPFQVITIHRTLTNKIGYFYKEKLVSLLSEWPLGSEAFSIMRKIVSDVPELDIALTIMS